MENILNLQKHESNEVSTLGLIFTWKCPIEI